MIELAIYICAALFIPASFVFALVALQIYIVVTRERIEEPYRCDGGMDG